MTPAEVSTALGDPLLRSQGHGFTVWLYDHRSEVVFYRGRVMAWTAPALTVPQAPHHP